MENNPGPVGESDWEQLPASEEDRRAALRGMAMILRAYCCNDVMLLNRLVKNIRAATNGKEENMKERVEYNLNKLEPLVARLKKIVGNGGA